jgi:hypothetical protein
MKKTNFVFTLAMTFAAMVFLTGCQLSSATPEEEAAQAKVDEAKQELKAAEKAATAEEWEAFKSESETRIRINEISIAEFRDKMSISDRKVDVLYEEKIDKLEKQNKDMKNRIVSYENRQSNWESFKSEFNHDMDEISKAMKDLLVDNK